MGRREDGDRPQEGDKTSLLVVAVASVHASCIHEYVQVCIRGGLETASHCSHCPR